MGRDHFVKWDKQYEKVFSVNSYLLLHCEFPAMQKLHAAVLVDSKKYINVVFSLLLAFP